MLITTWKKVIISSSKLLLSWIFVSYLVTRIKHLYCTLQLHQLPLVSLISVQIKRTSKISHCGHISYVTYLIKIIHLCTLSTIYGQLWTVLLLRKYSSNKWMKGGFQYQTPSRNFFLKQKIFVFQKINNLLLCMCSMTIKQFKIILKLH